MSFLSSKRTRLAAGLAVVSAFAALPMAAQAADTNLAGTIAAGTLANTAPAVAPFTVTLNGLTQTETTTVGAYGVTDASGTNDGYTVSVAASLPTVGGVAAGTGTGSTLTLTPTDATATTGNDTADGPVAEGAATLTAVASTIQTAAAGTGQGAWEFAADTGGVESLSIVMPSDASAGAYASTLTYTSAPIV